MYQLLYVKSNYSLLSSLLTIDDIIMENKKQNKTAAVLCDDTMYGVMEFIKRCRDEKIKPIIGLTIHLKDFDILAFVKDYQGYLNIIKLSTIQNTKQVEKEDLLQYKNNLIFILPFSSFSYYQEYREVLKDVLLGYSNLSEEEEVRSVTSNIIFLRECLYRSDDEKDTLKYLYMIRDGKTVADDISYDIYHKSMEIENILELSHNEGLLKTLEVCDQCNLTFPKMELLLPIYTCPDNRSGEEYLQELSKAGLIKRLDGKVPKNYQDRLFYELSVIKKMGFSNYFLVVYDFIRYAKKNKILVGPGRGSAAGSLVAYSLGITDIDPIQYDLLFERFLNPERVSMPDIDTDLPDLYRDDVISYVKEKYGEKRVAGIVTFGTLAAKQVIRDVGRVLNIPLYKVDRLNSYLPAMSKEKLDFFYQNNKEFHDFIEGDPSIKRLIRIARKIEGFPRQIGTHAAGIVMCKKDLDEVLPLTMSDEMYLTSYSMNYLEELGLLKMDFLGIKNLTLIMNILKDIKTFTKEDLEFHKIPLEDEKVYQMFSKGETTGVFQFESQGMRSFLRKLKPSSFEDIVAAIALFRPGPASNIDTFIRRKEGREKITYLDPSLEPILKKTYGIMIYQEQVMQTANIYAGYSLGEADILRRAISKKKIDLLKEEEKRFFEKARKLGRDDRVTKEIFSLILKFAGYGFNRSHAVAYSLVAYKMAYLKCFYPLYFYSSLLTNVIGVESKTREYLMEARSLNIKVLKPDINESSDVFRVKDDTIIFPISSIKGIGSTVCHLILEARKEPFTSLFDAFSKLVSNKVTRKQLEMLTLASCFSSFGYNKKTIMSSMDALMNYAELTKDLDPSLVLLPEIKEEEEFSPVLLLEQEKESFGFYISNHPVTALEEERKNTVLLEQVEHYFNKNIYVLIMVEKVKVIETKKGEKMAFLTGSDETKMMDFTLFPRVYQKYSDIKKGNICKIKGMVEKRYNQIQMIVNDIWIVR